ncbi:hypothetical protein FF38_12625 [Lucilia cuprina]|uniref:Uncharacterized protein n=1 Tax=Lucilia cuprina TaxID=7375 RepID=A0A0L0BMW4_LUCCU|nr:hypothetical protein FF38_12625 [Lucilia cuprina]
MQLNVMERTPADTHTVTSMYLTLPGTDIFLPRKQRENVCLSCQKTDFYLRRVEVYRLSPAQNLLSYSTQVQNKFYLATCNEGPCDRGSILTTMSFSFSIDNWTDSLDNLLQIPITYYQLEGYLAQVTNMMDILVITRQLLSNADVLLPVKI